MSAGRFVVRANKRMGGFNIVDTSKVTKDSDGVVAHRHDYDAAMRYADEANADGED